MNQLLETNIYSSAEEIRFNNKFLDRYEKLMETGRLDAILYLEMFAPHKVAWFKAMLRKLHFNYDGNLIVDITLPPFIGGYYNLKDTIAINPLYLLHASEVEIASIIVHEGVHAGVYTESEVHDESVTETIARKKIQEVYKDQGFLAYEDLVSQITEYFGDYSFQEMVELIESGDEETFDNFLEALILNPLFDDANIRNLEWKSIEKKLKKQWKFIKEMFPRIINSIQERNVNPHEEAVMDVRAYKFDGLLQKAAERLFNNKEQLVEVLLQTTKHIKTITYTSQIEETLRDEGFGYLVDFIGSDIQPFLATFVKFHNASIFNMQNIDVHKLQLAFKD